MEAYTKYSGQFMYTPRFMILKESIHAPVCLDKPVPGLMVPKANEYITAMF